MSGLNCGLNCKLIVVISDTNIVAEWRRGTCCYNGDRDQTGYTYGPALQGLPLNIDMLGTTGTSSRWYILGNDMGGSAWLIHWPLSKVCTSKGMNTNLSKASATCDTCATGYALNNTRYLGILISYDLGDKQIDKNSYTQLEIMLILCLYYMHKVTVVAMILRLFIIFCYYLNIFSSTTLILMSINYILATEHSFFKPNN